jgi:hypothetical protein
MLPSKLKKIALSLFLFWLFCFAFSKVGMYLIDKDTPPFLLEMLETSRASPIVLNKIGEYQAYEYKYNENDLTKDTLKYKFSIRGTEGEMSLGKYAINSNGKWILTKVDTTFTK